MNPLPALRLAIACLESGNIHGMDGLRTEGAKIFRQSISLLIAAQFGERERYQRDDKRFATQCDADAAYLFGEAGRWPCEDARVLFAATAKALTPKRRLEPAF